MDTKKNVSNRWVLRVTACFLLLASLAAYPKDSNAKPATGGRIESIWQGLMEALRDIKVQEQAAQDIAIEQAGIELGPWYSAGPFKDTKLGIHLTSFNFKFGPEEQVLSAGAGAINLARTWDVQKLPGMVETRRRWVEHAEWADGYWHQLPMGPPPGWNETIYIYRTIRAARDVAVDMDVYAEDNVRAWLNGEKVGEAYAAGRSSRFPADLGAKLRLKRGENRLLVKITCMHGARGFAFAIPLITPHNYVRPSAADYEKNPYLDEDNVAANKFYPGDEPFASGGKRYRQDERERYRMYRAEKDGIPDTNNPSILYKAYTKVLLKILELPDSAGALLPKIKDKAAVEIVRKLYQRAWGYSDALARVEDFEFDVPVVPMYDPANLEMNEVLAGTIPATAGGRSYLERLGPVKTKAEKALNDVKSAIRGARGEVVAAAGDIERMWSGVIGSLEPIAFVRSPAYWVNAIAPYTAEGASPASICIFDPARPDEPARVIYHDEDGAIFDMNISYDAKTIFFSAKSDSGVRGGWDIYEIGVDGTGLKRITYGDTNLRLGSTEDRFIDSCISPVELPSGEIMFVSTRAGTYVNCQSEPAGHLYVANRDGSNVRRVSGNTHSDHTPQVMNDGRVLFTRWDYGVDKNVFLRQSLWAMNPDGTRFQLFSGNTIENPNSFWEARPIPGRPEVVCVFGPHHTYHAGMIGLLWNRLGYEVPRGVGFRWVTQELPLVDDIELGWGYQDPYPINEHLFLVSYGGDGDFRNRIYILDDRGNKKCIYEDAELGCWDPVLLKPSKRPPVVLPQSKHVEFAYRDPTQENQNPKSEMGTFLLQDVYEGLGPHIQRGEIKSLAVMEQLSKTDYPLGPDVWGYSPTIGRGTMFVRRFVGTVPVEADGSAHFVAPAIKDISFNALDLEGRVLMKMGSTAQVMPGEVQSCIGCHENRFMAPPTNKHVPIAAKRAPSVPQQPDWGTNGIIDFVKVVQPVLDKYCVSCHSGPTPEGYVDLSNDKTRFFNMGYNQLVDRGQVNYANMNGTDHEETTPKAVGAIVSRIREKIETDHSGQVLPLVDRQRIYAWIDSGIPYYGTYTFINTNSTGGRGRWYTRDRNKWFAKDFMPVFTRRCYDCHVQQVNRQTYNYGPRHPDKTVTVTSRVWDDQGLMTAGFSSIGRMGPSHRINLTHPEWSQMLTAPLAKEAGGLGLCRAADGSPYIFKNRSDPDYKAMAEALHKGRDGLLADPRVDMLDWPVQLSAK